MKYRKILFSSACAAISLCSLFSPDLFAQNVQDLKHSIKDEAIIYPESFELDAQKRLESWYLKNYTATDSAYKSMPDVDVTDDVLIQRLKAMPTIIEMPFNSVVKDYILRYTKKGRAQVATMLGLSTYYMPIFEQELEAQGLPLELKYLPVIESALNPNAVSKHGATGLWQLMLATGKGLGLEVNSLVDERRDPYRSTERAVAFLKDLYDSYRDWSLVIAAYNCGPGEVNKAIRRAGGDPKKQDYWSIYNYLPAETRGYVPAFIAANYVMTYHNDHNIHPVLATKPLVTDTVAVRDRLHLQQVADVLNIPIEELRVLNPQFRADIIPATVDNQYFLILPSQQIHAYLLSEDEIMAHNREKYEPRDQVEPGDKPTDYLPAEDNNDVAVVQKQQPQQPKKENKKEPNQGQVISHKVKAGETLADIAKTYNVDPADIKEWNSLRRNSVRTGQQLRIYPSGNNKQQQIQQQPKQEDQAYKQQKKEQQKYQPQQQKKKKENPNQKKKKNKQKAQERPQYVKVKSGDSLDRIARQNNVSVEELKRANGIQGSGHIIQPGQKLRIPAKDKKQKANKKQKRKKGKK